jgi:hypothetical protein
MLGVTLFFSRHLLATTDKVEINGTVYASEWDANDNATTVVIFTEEGEEIAVSNSGKGLELLKLEDKNVTATGTIAIDENERKTISIFGYTVQE